MTTVEKIQHAQEFKYVYGSFPQQYVYTVGDTLEKFFNKLKTDGKIIGLKCMKCNITYVPPVSYCERCFSRLESEVAVADSGTVESYTVAYFDLDGNRLPKPEVWCLVKLEGASTLLYHKLLCENIADVKIGMEVKIKLKPADKRVGKITDIEGFVPI
jgi:hypothetical protein